MGLFRTHSLNETILNDTQHNDTQHNDAEHNDTQHIGLIYDTQLK
jgi:hypothetical protein